jgi:DNA repair exonuclease SbcCD ATPase subunit
MFKSLCGAETYKNVVVLTTFWDRVSNEEGVKREKELRSRVFKDLVDGGSHFMRFNRTMDSANNVLRHILTLAPRNIQIQKEICVDGKDLEETAAGSVRQEEMAHMISKHTEQIAEVQAEVEAVKQSDKAARQKAEEERDKLQKEVERLQNETAELRKGLDDKQSDKAARQKIEEERDKVQKEVERLRNETAELRKGLDDKQSDKAARRKIEEERDKLQKEVERLRNEASERKRRDESWPCTVQ